MLLCNAKGYTNKLNGKHITKPKIAAAMPKIRPNNQNNIFIPINQVIPPKSNENISPGNLTTPQDAMAKKVYFTQLLLKNTHEANVNDKTAIKTIKITPLVPYPFFKIVGMPIPKISKEINGLNINDLTRWEFP